MNRCKELPPPPTTSPAEAKDFFLREFKDVLVSKEDLRAAPLKPMKGPPMKIQLKDSAVPFAVHTPRQIPFAFRNQVKEELDSMVAQGIIKPTGDEPSEWCHPLIVVPKNSGVRITVDLTKLNSQVPVQFTLHQLHLLLFVVWTQRQDTSLQRMPCAVIGRWNLPKRTRNSPLSSHRMDDSSIAEDQWASQLQAMHFASVATWPSKICRIMSRLSTTYSYTTKISPPTYSESTRCSPGAARVESLLTGTSLWLPPLLRPSVDIHFPEKAYQLTQIKSA